MNDTYTLSAFEVNTLLDILQNLASEFIADVGDTATVKAIENKLYHSLDVVTDDKYDERVIFATTQK